MRAVWAAIVSVWVVIALVTVFAWSRPQTPVASPQPALVLVKGKNGTQQLVVVRSASGPAHATTRTSPPPP